MQDTEPGISAWLLCEDIFNRIKNELITQAMDTLQIAIDAKIIEVSGSLVTLPDKPGETEMQMFIINRLVGEKDSILERYKAHMAIEPDKNDPNAVIQKERLKKFLLCVEQISMLM